VTARGGTGAVVYQGPSRIGPGNVVVILTWTSGNAKIGPMVQAWILTSDAAPHVAIQTGQDRAACGDCPRAGGDGCYVATHRAPRSVYETWRAGGYETLPLDVAALRLAGQRLRIGAYGDPSAVSPEVWAALTSRTSGHTSYTHGADVAPELRASTMASADSPEEARRYQAAGWRTYRVRRVDRQGVPEPLERGEIACPASTEGGKATACAWCLLCDGQRGATDARRNVAIIDHSGTTSSRVVRLRRSQEGAALAAV